MKYVLSLVLSLAPLLLLLGDERKPEAFKLDDGDCVVFLGNTLIEREQRSGWWEYALTTRFPGKKVIFRNLGWSGDTVFGDARAGFNTAVEGFKRLKEHTLSLKPTVIVLGYGVNESFAGPAGLPAFTKGLDTLLDALAPAKARMVLLSPLRQGDMGRPLPDPAAQNRNLRLYADVIRNAAKKRGCLYIDLYDRLGDIAKVTPAVTENGIHLNPRGYQWSAGELEKGLGIARIRTTTVSLKNGPLTFREEYLPIGPRTLIAVGLPPGKHTLLIDKKPVVAADAGEWAKGVKIESGPEFDQAEKLRKLIVAKNELYFHRWRPQNWTYLYGFRKHEQGKNASEIPKFDPLVEAREKEIVALSVPVAHRYEWTAGK